ncbi:hypothetical protein AB1Y20_015585 [Prymnesium parvum]|uniref:Tudor domain-containing protein n=1 Tax=Prymnesium parvum TaxID=97485 RepID=A0AB34JYT5_PRYPA
MAGVQLGERVAVWSHEDGKWLEGAVVELNTRSGEFLVDFDDEMEGQGWCSVNGAWKRLSPHIPSEPPLDHDRTQNELFIPVLQKSSEAPPIELPPKPASPEQAALPSEGVPAEGDAELLHAFGQLYQDTMRFNHELAGLSQAQVKQQFLRLAALYS